jgi:hypothetical protein
MENENEKNKAWTWGDSHGRGYDNIGQSGYIFALRAVRVFA